MGLLLLGLLCVFFACFILILATTPGLLIDSRPTLKLSTMEEVTRRPRPKGLKGVVAGLMRGLSVINKPLSVGPLAQRIRRDLGMAKVPMTVEEFWLVKEMLLLGLFFMVFNFIPPTSDLFIFSVLMSFAIGYFGPEFWLKGQTKKIKEAILNDLPDTVDLLGLCVNAGLDFMMALKYVVEKSKPTVIVDELRGMIQEINVGKPRRDALRDMARKYELPDLSTFSRTLIQADRMGTSVSDALNILSEDMRETRYRRGEAMAMKAPLKMLVPLLFCIFPVVAILVAGPVFLDFFQNNPLKGLGSG